MSFGKRISLLLPVLIGGLVSGSFAAMEFKEADITTVKNIVERNEGSGAVPAKVNDKITENAMVSTAAASMAELTFADSSITRMGSNTQFSFKSKERLVKLEQGTVLIHTPPGNGGATVDAGGVTAAVSGTTFMASRDASGNAMFVLLEGQGGLKVTVGGSSTVIRPGQAASVGADAIQEAKSSAPSGEAGPAKPGSSSAAPADDAKPGSTAGGGSGPGSSAPASGGGEGGSTPPPAATPKIQVFDVDVKKVVATTPLIVEFKSELPSAAKIEKTVEIQQTAVKEGKLEKLEVEVVAVKSKDGDVLVGAPRVEKEEMVVVNKKADVVGAGRGGDNLDIDTAAGPGAGGGSPSVAQAAPPPASAPAGPAAPAPSAAPVINTVSQVAAGTVTTVRPIPTAMTLSFSGSTGTVTLDQPADGARTVTLNLPGVSSVVIPSGSRTASFTVNPALLFPGASGDASVTASSGNLTASSSLAGVFADSSVRQSVRDANPLRDLPEAPASRIFSWTPVPMAEGYELDFGRDSLNRERKVLLSSASYEADGNLVSAVLRVVPPGGGAPSAGVNLTGTLTSDAMSPAELAALDNYFYFTGRGPGATGGPSSLFSAAPAAGNLETMGLGSPVSLGLTGQPYDLYTAQTWQAPASGASYLYFPSPLQKAFYGDRIELAGTALWTSLSSWNGAALPAAPSDVLWDLFLGQLSDPPSATSLVWDDRGGNLFGVNGALQINGFRDLVLAAGDDGIRVQGAYLTADTYYSGGPRRLELTTAGDLEIGATEISGIGSAVSSANSPELRLQAAGKVKLGAQTVAGVSPPVALAEQQQVRLEADSTSLSPSLAVIRTGNSLELRNVVIRNFSGTKLEKVTRNSDGTTTLNGRVLMSGSAVQDFKIKELVGAAVNADAKIQMMAMDGSGALAGEMMVQGELPVATQLAGAVAAAQGTPLGANDASASTPVHASMVDLAAQTVNFNNATITAMNAITARANTVLVQNSFMTVVRATGMINLYVRDGIVNPAFGTVREGQANFAGVNTFQFGNSSFTISSQSELTTEYGSRLFDTQNSAGPVAGAINVLNL